MKNSLLSKVRKDIEENNLLKPNAKVVVGVSGGADSVCLLKALIELKKAYNLSLFVVHVNHGLRGLEANKDQEYVMEICKDWGIDAKAYFVNIKNLSDKLKISEEEAGREARYRIFNKILKDYSFDYIAVAHNREDRAETIMFNIIRGTGLDGLCGMPIKQGRIIRPFFNISRKEIETYLKINKIPYRTDKTNLSNDYSRNRIRNQILPMIRSGFNVDPTNQLLRLSDIVCPERDYLAEQTEKHYKKALIEEILSGLDDDKIMLSRQYLNTLPLAIYKRIIRLAWERINSNSKNFEAVHVDRILSLCQNNGTGKKVSLPNKIEAQMSYERLIFSKINNNKAMPFTYIIDKEDVTEINELGAILRGRIIDQDEFIKINIIRKTREKDYTQFFDLDLFNGDIIIRSRLDGDRIRPYKANGEKKLKDFFIDQKVPREQRMRTPLVAQDNKIAWVIGMRTSDEFRAREDSKKILMLSWHILDNGGNKNA